MKTYITARNQWRLLGATGAALIAAIVMANGSNIAMTIGDIDVVGTAYAEPDSGDKGKGSHGANRGGQGGTGSGGQMGKGAAKVLDAADDDSDRPAWAGGDKELNPHRGTPNPTSGTKKGDAYGDLWVVVRNPVTGEPILVGGEYQVCLDAACTETVLTVGGELPEGVTAAEVELGRSNVVRSPEKVTQHALDEVLTKLTSATSVTLDSAGRLMIDGATVDSPLENLALYIALMTGDSKLTPELLAKLPGDTSALAASLLAGGADKTGEITLDFLVYFNVITGITDTGTYVDYGTFDYDRATTYSGEITYFVQAADGTVTEVTKPILEAVFNNEPYTSADGAGASDFTQAADDALQMIEFIHTQIHTE